MRLLRLAPAFLILLSLAANAQEGRFIGPRQHVTESLELTQEGYSFRSQGEGLPPGGQVESAKIARRDARRLVLGPFAERERPYEVLWIFNSQPGFLTCYRDGVQYATVEEVPLEPTPRMQRNARRYWSEREYQRIDGLPTMPAPNREQLIRFLQDCLEAVPPGMGAASEMYVEDLLVSRGLCPWKSKPAFIQARKSMEDDPQVKALVEQLQARAK